MLHGRRDSTHKEIREELRALGASVEDDGDAGGDHMDFRVGLLGVMTFQVEAKTPTGRKAPVEQLTDAQEKLIKRWRGNPVIALHSIEEAREWYLNTVRALSPLVRQLRLVAGGARAIHAEDVFAMEAKRNAKKQLPACKHRAERTP
jgi:hypothetical protein